MHHNCRHLLSGKTLPAQELEYLSAALIYRLKAIIARATEYKDRLGLVHPDCHECARKIRFINIIYLDL